jgi:hypothetical protein
MQIPLLNGIFTDSSPDVRTSYPVNLVPVPKASGVSNEYLRPADGLIAQGTGPGVDRGGINYEGTCYRVMGSKLVTVSSTGAVTILGDVGDDNKQVTLDYSFTQLGIASNGNLFFWDFATSVLTQNVDPDLGVVLDVVWVDGYWMTTDGEFLVVTELTNPLDVNPLKYGSSEVDPDPIVAVLKLRNEVYALNRHTIEVFDNIGGDFFPFGRIDGAQIEKGCVGTHACCNFVESIAFLGGGMNEAPGIYLGGNASAIKISTQEVDEILALFTEAQLSLCKLEARNDRTHLHLYVHLPDRTLVYDASASEATKQQIWFTLTSTLEGFSRYRAQNWVWCFDKWLAGDPLSTTVGYATDTIGSHWGQDVRWEFGTLMAYNGGKGAVVHELELAALTGAITYEQLIPESQVDPHFSKVKLLLHMDGTSGSTTFVDNSPVGYTMTAFGDAQIDTSNVKFGTGSLVSDSTGDYLEIDYPDKGFITAVATDPWTAEMWVYSNTYNSIRWNSPSATQFSLGAYNGFSADFLLAPITGANLSTTNYAVPTFSWSFIAVVNDPVTATMRLYINGVEVASQTNKPMTTMARVSAPGSISFNGNVDDVRITVGVARYTSNFTPPTQAFPNYGAAKGIPRIFTSYSLDGQTWSQEQAISIGGPGDRSKRLVWRRQGFMRHFRMQRFRGDSAAHVTFLRIEAQIEALAY